MPTVDLFSGIPQHEFQVAGQSGKLPIFYRDTTSMNAVFTASTAKVARFLPHPGLHPVELRPGRCLVNIATLEYRQSDLGPYNEVCVGVLARFERRPVPVLDALAQVARHAYSIYIWHLPVTTEIARAAGVELYGYPKIVADIAFARGDRNLECTVSQRGTRILRLVGRESGPYAHRRLNLKLYSMRDGTPLCTDLILEQLQFAQTFRREAVKLELGTGHPMAAELAGVDLDPSAVLFQLSPVGQGILFGPRPATQKPLARVGT